ncbi:MAG: NFACT family protein [Armatimonadota bacterium]|nr:NFACT family protein [Armatimonadota bacterium]MDR7519015.1 NFACT family protein [Armatimonadota bacterium]MDR7549206.1 NFACT family protein [Armatimonadota bacterium]
MDASPSAPAMPPASFDSVILAAVAAECQDLAGARVQRIVQVGPETLALVLRRSGPPRTLLISAHPQWCRMHLTTEAAPTGPGPFAQMLRSRLEGAALRAIEAAPFERLATCTFDALEGPQDLIAELMGRQANLILTSGGVIVGVLKPAGPGRTRDLLPQRPYARPPQPKPDPRTVLVDHLLAAAPADRPAWRILLQAVAGIGPAMAHEACLRAGVDPAASLDRAAATRVVEVLRAIAEDVLARRFSPRLYQDPDGRPVAYAAFPMHAYAGCREHPASMSTAVEAVTALAEAAWRLDSARRALAAAVAQALGRVRRALEAVEADLREAEAAEHLRQYGELLLAYLPQVAPGATSVDVPGFDGRPTRIPLDPARSGVENAQAYFKRYARAAATRRRLPTRRAALEGERAFLEGLATAIAQAETEDDLWEVEQDLIAAGLWQRTRAGARAHPVSVGRVFAIDGYRVQVGRSARENDHLTFEVAKPDDLWLHARGMPGAHVILTGGGREPPDAVVEAAARIAAHYSAGRASGKVPVDVTRRRHVRRLRGGRPGQVTYTNERTLVVAPGLPASTR